MRSGPRSGRRPRPVRSVGTLQRALELRLASDQERRVREPLEVRRAQGLLAIGHDRSPWASFHARRSYARRPRSRYLCGM